MAVKQKVVECVDPAKSEARLQMLVRTLQELGPVDAYRRHKACTEIVTSLGAFQIPTDPEEYKKFMSDIYNVQELLVKECANNDVTFSILKAVYDEISNPCKNVSPAMSIVLQLIKVQNIPGAVNWILNSGRYSEQHLERVLSTLCNWLSKWTCTKNLGPIVLSFMEGLETEQHYDILLRITTKTVETLFKLLILPDCRDSIGPVVTRMLSKVQNDPSVFRKIVPRVGAVVASLEKENSESSRRYLEIVIDLCFGLMEVFPPEHPNGYDALKVALRAYGPPRANYKRLIDCPSWFDRKSEAMIDTRSFRDKVGLNNLGNTCYMNSVLQALFMTKLFRNRVLSMSKDSMPALFANLQDLFVLLQHSPRSSLSPDAILHLARPPGFQMGHQHDSSEFLGYLLDVLHEQERLSVSGGGSVVKAVGGAGADCQEATLHGTIVQRSFGGRTTTVSQCGACEMRSEKGDNFRELQLSFPNNSDDHSVSSLLHYYLQPEKLCDENQYHCEKCDRLTDGERVTGVVECPSRLILTLKHFGYDSVSQQKTKLLQRVHLQEYIQLNHINYELYASVVHCGSSVDSGHYYTFAKDRDDWYKFNDCSVYKTTSAQLCDLRPPETAYILFYRRADCAEPDDLSVTALSQRLQGVLVTDKADFDGDKRRITTRSYYNTRQNNRNDDPPPPGCGDGGGFSNSSANMYVC